jgi:hypothetical protein
LEIGNGYGVPGGGAYYNSVRPPMFTIAADPNLYKPDFNVPSSNSMFDPRHPGHYEGVMGPSDGADRFDVQGAKNIIHGNSDEQAAADQREIDQRDLKEAEGFGEKGNIPDFLKERLKARGILKGENNNENTHLVSHHSWSSWWSVSLAPF